MKAAALVFRFRVVIFLLLYLLGFLAPWGRWFPAGHGTLWLAISTLLSRLGTIGVATATLVVTLLALASLAAGAVLRLWGTAYLGSATMQGAVFEGRSVMAAGPYRYVRNPLYLGSWLLALGTSVLMSPAGALFFLLLFTVVTLLLIFGEENFLTATAGSSYQQYRQQVPRLLPGLLRGPGSRAGVPGARPQWLQALLAETYPVTFTLCFAVFAWRYNVVILIRCLLISYGLSLIVRATYKAPPREIVQ